MEKLRGIVYVSKALVDFNMESLEELADKAAQANKKLGITGYLYYENKYFLQYIEGQRDAVQSLMSHISRDPRHEVVNSITSDNLYDRYFPSWNMHHLTKPALIQVKMEDIIIDYIDALAKAGLEKIEGSKINVWNMINKLSKMRLQLSRYY
jgi:predicted sulfurtransferase